MPNLTKSYVDKIPPLSKEKIYWDAAQIGFGVRVSPKGRKTFVVQYRSGTRTKRMSIGIYGNLTVEQARKTAKKILGEVASGYDPAARRQSFRKSPTMEEVCSRFIAEYVETRLKPSTQKEYKRNIELYILPKFRTYKVKEVTQDDVSRTHSNLSHKPYQANRNLGVLSRIFNLCETWGYRDEGTNPCRHIVKYPEKKRETFLSKREIRNLVEVLDRRLLDDKESIFVTSAFKLLLFTGCRLSEIQFLKWSYIKDSHIEFPDTKTGYKRLPISPMVRALLDEVPRLPNNPFVIVGNIEGQACSDLQKPWRRIRRAAGLGNARIHDLRHTFASHAVMSGQPLPIVAKLLGHTQIQTTMRYAHLSDDEVKKASNQISALLIGE